MTSNCDFYSVPCDQCTSDLSCRDFLPGVAGFCYQYGNSIASFVQGLLPASSGAYGLYLAAKKLAPSRETTESWRQYASKAVSSLRSGFGSACLKAKEAVAAKTNESRGQHLFRLASQPFQFAKNNPGKAIAVAASVFVPQFAPAVLQMPAITALALGALGTIKNGDEWTVYLKDFVTQRPDENINDFRKRVGLYSVKTLAILGVLGTLGGVVIPQVIQRSTAYNIWLPLQTHVTAFCEYNPLVWVHSLLALQDSANKKRLGVLFHSLAALSTLAFPFYIIGSGQDLRLHHFWIGQFLQTLPTSAAKLFGLILSVDGWVQLITPTGYNNYDNYEWDYSSYGCDNVVMNNFDNIIFAGSLAVLMEGMAKILFSQSKPEDQSFGQTLRSQLNKISRCWHALKSQAQRCCIRSSEADESTRLTGALSADYTLIDVSKE